MESRLAIVGFSFSERIPHTAQQEVLMIYSAGHGTQTSTKDLTSSIHSEIDYLDEGSLRTSNFGLNFNICIYLYRNLTCRF